MNRSRLVLPLVMPLLWFAAPVEAGSDRAVCADGAACVWDRTDFQGSRAEVPASGCIDSNIRSAVNRTEGVLEFFLSGGCVGARAGTLQPGQETARMSAASATGDCTSDVVDSCGADAPSPTP